MTTMQSVFNPEDIASFRLGQMVAGTVVHVSEGSVLVELPGGNTGLIPRKEKGHEDDLDEGTEIKAIIINTENEQGLIMLSLRRASQDMVWAELNTIQQEERTVQINIEDANKGGLVTKYKGIKCFLPVSQLMPQNYPRVGSFDSGEILDRLQKHIGKEFIVKIMNVNREDNKVIVSEKLASEDTTQETLKNIRVNDVVIGTVSGVVKFGVFVTFGGVEGLVHVSELAWSHVSNPSKLFSLGDEVEVMIIGIDGDKLSFSIKQLSEDPWIELGSKYKAEQKVSGKVVRWNDLGVFIEIESEVQGLIPIEAFKVSDPSELRIEAGQEMKAIVRDINQKSHRLELDAA